MGHDKRRDRNGCHRRCSHDVKPKMRAVHPFVSSNDAGADDHEKGADADEIDSGEHQDDVHDGKVSDTEGV